jgi:hypothetical protein
MDAPFIAPQRIGETTQYWRSQLEIGQTFQPLVDLSLHLFSCKQESIEHVIR